MNKTNKELKINPSLIKDKQGKIIEIFIDIKTWKNIVKKINAWDKIKKESAKYKIEE